VKIPSHFRSRWLGQSATLLYAIVAFFCIAIVWSFWAQLDQVSRAPGEVIPAGRIQVLQATNGGAITKILVREGDHVQKGQLLMQLDQSQVKSAVDEGEGRVVSLMCAMARIRAELFDKPLSFPKEAAAWPDFVNDQTILYHKRRQALADGLASLHSMLNLNQEELGMNMPLLKNGDVSKADVLRIQRSVADIQSQIDNVRNKYLQDLQTEYTKDQEDLVTAREALSQRKDMLRDTDIRAPVDGIVKNVKLTTIGGVFRPGDEELSIVPTGQQLIVEAKVAPRDIAYVRKGDSASIKFDAYDSSIYGTASGKVTYVSPDTLTEQLPTGEMTYYRVQLEADTSRMKHSPGEKIEIQPGMTAIAEIQTGKNTVWRYLTKPINKTFGEAMQER